MKFPIPFPQFDITILGHHPGNDAKKAKGPGIPPELPPLSTGQKIADFLPFKFRENTARRLAMEALGPAGNRNLTNSAQNYLVLKMASALVAGTVTKKQVEDAHGPAVAFEAQAAADSRKELAALQVPVHMSVVWAMYNEKNRMHRHTAKNPHGEDFVRTKVVQLDWLTKDLPGITWSIIACDDGCPQKSAERMEKIVRQEKYPRSDGHRSVRVLKLADVIGKVSIGTVFNKLTSTDESRKGGAIVAGIDAAIKASPVQANGTSPPRHVVCYTDADLSANLAQLGALVAPVVAENKAAALGQRYGMPGAVLIREEGPVIEPQSTGGKPDKMIILFRHFVRAQLLPNLEHVLDTQAGFKAFDAAALTPAIGRMESFKETFDIELLLHLTQGKGADALAVKPIVFTEDFAATNFRSVEPGESHLRMVKQIVDIYTGHVAKGGTPATGDAARLLNLLEGLDLHGYQALITHLSHKDAGDTSLFDRRWPVQELFDVINPPE